MRAVVTGASGFIGSHLCRRLVESGYEVLTIAQSTTEFKPAGFDWRRVQRFDFDELGGLTARLNEFQPDTVFHLASLFVAEHRPHQVVPLVQSNVQFGAQLLEAMSGLASKRFVNVSTTWVHYRNEAYNPVCLYAATKQAFRDILRFYEDALAFKSVTVELFDSFGPFDNRRKLVHHLFSAAGAEKPLLLSGGEQVLHLSYVDDVVDALFRACELVSRDDRLRTGPTYVVDTDEPVSLRQLVERIEGLLGKRLNVEFGRRPYREREVFQPWPAGQRLPGWKPRVSLARGLAAVWEHHARA